MRPDQFDYDAYHRRCERVNGKAAAFLAGEYLPVGQYSLGDSVYSYGCRDRTEMLPVMLDGIAKTIATENDWLPYLEPWHGIGVFAEAFGCPFLWSDTDAPWTRTIVSDIDGLRRLEKPDIDKSAMLKMVLDTTEYFNEQTKGEIHIAPTDTQGPLSTMSLVCDVTWMLMEAWDYPEDFHRALGIITDLIIEFTIKQQSLCARPTAPGHTMWSPDSFKGVSLSDDMLAMVGADFYREFGLPYDTKIAQALGGVGIHSCGRWAHNFAVVQEIENITMVDLAISRVYDPNPNLPGKIIEGFGGTSVPVQVRCDPRDRTFIDELLASDVRTILSFWWDEDPANRKRAYEDTKRSWEKLH